MGDVLIFLLLSLVPLAVIVGFIISVVKYKRCPKENSDERKGYKFAAVILGIIFGVMVLTVALLILLLVAAVAYM